MVILGQLFDFFGFLGENFPQNRVYWNYNQPHNSLMKNVPYFINECLESRFYNSIHTTFKEI